MMKKSRDELKSSDGNGGFIDDPSEHGIAHVIDGSVTWYNDVVSELIEHGTSSVIGEDCHLAICHRKEPCELITEPRGSDREEAISTRVAHDVGTVEMIRCYGIDPREGRRSEVLTCIHHRSPGDPDSSRDTSPHSRYRSLIVSAPDLVGMVDHKAKLLYAHCYFDSPSYKHLIGKSLVDVIRAKDPNALRTQVKSIFEEGHQVTVEAIAEGEDGQDHMLSLSFWPISDGDTVKRAYIVVRDVTWEEQALSALLKTEARFRSIFNEGSIGIVQTNSAGRISDANPAFSSLLGYTREEMLGRSLASLIVEDTPEQFWSDVMDGIMNRKGPQRFEAEVRTRGGGMITVAIESYLHTDDTNDSKDVLFIVEDISESVRVKDALKEHLEHERMLIDFSRDMTSILSNGGFEGVERVLKHLSSFLGVDAVLVAQEAAGTAPYVTQFWLEDAAATLLGMDRNGDEDATREHLDEVVEKVLSAGGQIEHESDEDPPGGTALVVEGLGSFLFVSLGDPKDDKRHLIVQRVDACRHWEPEDHIVISHAANILAAVIRQMDDDDERESFFRHTSDLLGIFDRKGGVFSRVNPAFERMIDPSGTRFDPHRMWKLIHPEDIHRLEHHLAIAPTEAPGDTVQLRIISLDGDVKWAELRFSASQDGTEVYVVGQDITRMKRAMIEEARKRMHVSVDEGLVYLELDKGPKTSGDIVAGLVDVGYHAIVMSRSPQLNLPGVDSEGMELYWFAETEDPRAILPDVDSIRELCSGFPPRSVVLVDRLDYLLMRMGFDQVLEVIHFLTELAYLRQHIVLVSVDPKTLTDHQLGSLSKECSLIEPTVNVDIPTEFMDIIRIANVKSMTSMGFGYMEVMDELGLSKPTVRKRISSLIQRDYLVETGTGRKKQFTITDRGRKLIR